MAPQLESEPTVTELHFVTECDIYVTREATSDEWDRDSTDGRTWVETVSLTKPDSWHRETLAVPFKVTAGMDVFAVTAHYSTGDTFGRDGGKMELIDVFLDQEAAAACRKAAGTCGEDSMSFKYVRQNGVEIQQSAPWIGYFESLDSVEVTQFTVEA